MNQFKFSGLILLAILFLSSCSSNSDQSWTNAIPEKAPFVIIPAEDATLKSVLESSYTPFLDDITSSANQLLSQVDSTANESINLEGIMLYTGTGNHLETVWIANTPPEFLNRLEENFYEPFAQNEYFFHDIEIHKLNIQDRILFAAQLHDNLLISESSLGIEDAIRAYLDRTPRADLSNITLEPGHIIMNTPSLDEWGRQLTNVSYRPMVKNALRGTTPTLLAISQEGEEQQTIQFSGNIPLSEENPSDLVSAFSSENAPISLDRYVSSNAAAFGLFRLPPRLAPPSTLPDTTQLDSTLLGNSQQYTEFSKTLDSEFALVMYTESGFLTTGEHLFLRKVAEPESFREQLNELENDGLIQSQDNIYYIQSSAIGKLVGSDLSGFQNFYLDVVGDAIVISKRKGLVEMVTSDHDRRRTMYYEQSFRNIKEELSEEISGLFISGENFYSFLEPFLTPENYVDAITSKFNLLSASATLDESEQNLSFNLTTYQTEDRSAPYREKWLFPTGSDISGEPVLADIGGSDQEELIFATKSGNVFALAADGTVVMEANTGSDEPIGSPVVYDWYATNENVILLAAGNKIYGWNDNGQQLPKFPFELDEPVTSPLLVNDIDRNGLPDALVATADRQLHALNGRGENISGWPVTTNAEIQTKPTVESHLGGISILAFAENAVHAWDADGDERKGYPKFIDASLNGSPIVYNNNIIGNAANGSLYAIGTNKLFADSLNVYDITTDSSEIEAVYASNSSLVGTPSVHDLTVETGDNEYDETMILTMSSNGSIFLLNSDGILRFNQNMGQPAATAFSPFVTDIDNNGQEDVIALANFGRLYVWDISNGERIYSVPTSGMQYPIVTDIDDDGFKELIAQTSQGLRAWTIFGSDEE